MGHRSITTTSFTTPQSWSFEKCVIGNGLKRPTPILREIKPETVPEVIVTPIGSEESKILELSGGKGHSLSLMKSLESEEVGIFKN